MSNVVLNPGAGGSTLGTDQVGGVDYQIVKPGFSDAGNVPVQVSAANPLPITAPAALPISAAALPLPAGASTAAKQPALGTAGAASADVLSVQGVAGMTALKVDGSAVTQPVSGTVTANQGGAPWSENLAQVGGVAISQGQKVMASSVPVVVASDQAAIPVTANAGTNLNTSALLLDATFTARVNTQGQKAMVASTPIVIASDQSAVPISGTVTTNPPANASTNVAQFGGSAVATGTGVGGVGIPRVTISSDSSLAANQSVNVNQVGGAALTEGQKAMAASVPVVIASDQSAVPVSGTVTVNQGGAPWAENITQFAGSAVVTGTGIGGAGIPRVTVSSDSFPATQAVSGTVTANQGGAPWSENITQFAGVAISTGTGVGGVGIPRVTVSNDSQMRVWDGTNQAAVKAASIAAVAADPALVVAISPNNSVHVSASVSGTNTTAVALGANASFTGTSDQTDTFGGLTIEMQSDQNGTLQLQWGTDGVNWDYIQTFTYLAANGAVTYGASSRSRRFRLIYTNGPVAQSFLRLQTILRDAPQCGDITQLQSALQPNTPAQTTRSQVIGQTDSTGATFSAATIKAASVAPAAIDSALVVTLNPNNANTTALATLIDVQRQVLAELRTLNVLVMNMSGADLPSSTFLDEQTLQ